MHPCNPRSGNVLFLILIAVALFAALSYAVTSSNRGGTGNTKAEQAELQATALLNYVNEFRTASLRMRMTGNCKAEQFSFESAPYNETNIYTQYPNANAPSDKRCHFFHPAGGGISLKKASELKASIGTTYTASCKINGLNANNYLILGAGGIPYETCKAINQALGYNAPSFEPNQVPYNCSASHFIGSYTTGGLIVSETRQPAGCIIGTGSANGVVIGSGTGQYWFYATLTDTL